MEKVKLINNKKVAEIRYYMLYMNITADDIYEDIVHLFGDKEADRFEKVVDKNEGEFYISYEDGINIAIYNGLDIDMVKELFNSLDVLANPLKKILQLLDRFKTILYMKDKYTYSEKKVLISYFYELMDKIYFDYRLLKYNESDNVDKTFEYINNIIEMIDELISENIKITLTNIFIRMCKE